VRSLFIHTDANTDLQAIRASGDLRGFGVLLAFLQQAKTDDQILESLSEDFFGVDTGGAYDVKKLVGQHSRGRHLWRVRLYDLKGLDVPYRVIYAVNPSTQIRYVLAIMPRDVNYDEDHPRIRKLLAVYDRLGIGGDS
jgi:hypothetical protein